MRESRKRPTSGQTSGPAASTPDNPPRSRAVGRSRISAGFPYHHYPVRFGDGQRLEKHRIDHRENSGIGADSQGQRQDGDRAKTRIPQQGPEAIAKILPEELHRHSLLEEKRRAMAICSPRGAGARFVTFPANADKSSRPAVPSR